MRSAIIAGLSIVVALALSAAGLGGYWHYKVAPLMARAELKVMPHAFVPVRVGEVRKFDLGYATFSLPSSVAGEFYDHAGKGIVSFGSAPKPPYLMNFFCPADGRSEPFRKFFGMVATASGNSPMNWYEYQKLVLTQRPLTLWDAIRQGLKGTRLGFVLLESKMLCVGSASDVRVFEKDGVGVLVFTYPQGDTRLMISSLAAGSFQGVWINPTHLRVDEIVSALAESYVLKARDYSAAAIALQIEQAGIKPVVK
ncbi:MAG: hypothetical protein ABSA05_13340 [Opitutaceae bacterium]|jgi:hypothetical protein